MHMNLERGVLAGVDLIDHFDLIGADQTLRDICNEPSTTPVQFSVAMHKLADWYLKLGHDPIGARHALERISHRVPGTRNACARRAPPLTIHTQIVPLLPCSSVLRELLVCV